MMSSWTNYGCYMFLVLYICAAQDIHCPCYYAEKINNLFKAGTRPEISHILDNLDEEWYAIGVLLGVPRVNLDVIQVENGDILESKHRDLARYLITNYEYTLNVLEKKERNPLSEPSLQQAFLVAHDVENTYSLGLLLGVNKQVLDDVFGKEIPLSQVKLEILGIWLRNASETPTYQVLEKAVEVLQKAESEMAVIRTLYFTMASDHWGVQESDYDAADHEVNTYGMMDWYLLGVCLDVPKHILDKIERTFKQCERYDSDRCIIETVHYWVTQHIKRDKKCDFDQLRRCCKIASNPDAEMIGNVIFGRDRAQQYLAELKSHKLTLRNALEMVIEIRDRWYEFGILIGIDKYKLDRIEQKYQSSRYLRCIIDVLDHWMKMNWQSSWKDLQKAKNRVMQQTPASPDETSVPEGSLNLMNAVYAASNIKDWYQFGKQLGLSEEQLRYLDHRQDIRRMVIEVIHLWLTASGHHQSREVFNSAVSDAQSDSCPTLPNPYTTMQSTSSVATMEPDLTTLTQTQALRYALESGADNWYMLGVNLGISKQFLNSLLRETYTITEKIESILQKWFESGRVSFKELDDAIDSSKVTVYFKAFSVAIKSLQKICNEKANIIKKLKSKLEKINHDHELEEYIKYLESELKEMMEELFLVEISMYETTLWTVQKTEDMSRLTIYEKKLDDYSASVTYVDQIVDQKIVILKCKKVYERLIKRHTNINKELEKLKEALKLRDTELLDKLQDITSKVQENQQRMKSINDNLEYIEPYTECDQCDLLHNQLDEIEDDTEKLLDLIEQLKIRLELV